MLSKIKTIDTTSFKFNVEKVNPLFSKSKIYVMYHGKNRNASNISKEAVESSLDTIFNTPIVGEFVERNGEGNFGGHGGKIEITDDDIKFVHTTKPIGVIPESAKISWEIVKDNKDIEREYLVIDGAYLWNRYSDEIDSLKEDNFGQSMEIEVFDGEWNEEENTYDIKDFAFSAFCILGIDKDGEGHVEPAFEDAKIITYSLDKESFKKEFTQMLSELKFILEKEDENTHEKEDEENMLEKLLEKYSLKMEDLTAKEFNFEEISKDELEAKIIEVFEIEVSTGDVVDDETVETEIETEVDTDIDTETEVEAEGEAVFENDEEKFIKSFELSHDDIRAHIYQKLDDYIEDNNLGNKWDFYIVSVYDDTFITKDDWGTNKKAYRISYTKTDDSVTLGEYVEVFEMYLTEEEKNSVETAKDNYELLVEENERLKAFETETNKTNHENQVSELFARFQLNEEDVKDIDIHEFSLSEIEEKCYAIIGRKLASKENFAKTNEEKSIRLLVNDEGNNEEDTPYGDLFDKYNK